MQHRLTHTHTRTHTAQDAYVRLVALSHLDLKSDGLQAPQRVAVEGVKGLVPHDGGLQHVPAPAVEHEQSLVHLHGLVWTQESGPRERERTFRGGRRIKHKVLVDFFLTP